MTLLGGSEPETRPQRTDRVAAVVLAAGRGERFGAATKQLATLDGAPLVAHAVRTAHEAGVDRVVVVVGHDGDAVAAAAEAAAQQVGRTVEVVHNPDHRAGQATSLVAGIGTVIMHGDAVAVVLLADQPGIGAESVRAVGAAVLDGAPAARATYVDGSGHPVAFARSVLDRVAEVSGDRGARSLLAELDVAPVLVGGPVPDDVDEPADLDRLRAADGDREDGSAR